MGWTPKAIEDFPFAFTWGYRGETFRSSVLPVPCSKCGAVAIVELPVALRAEQTDGTTHVCHPVAGGCNHGFAVDPPRSAEAEGAPCGSAR